MRFSHFACIAAALLLGACSTVEQAAKPTAFAAQRAPRKAMATIMPAGILTPPPGGYEQLCGGAPELCGLSEPAAAANVEPADRMAVLTRVNRAVNAEVYPVAAALVGSSPWSRPILQNGVMMGDCKNYAVEKRQRLLAAGFPAQDLFYAIAYRRDVGLHAVLVAEIDGRDFVLDNRSPWVVPWSEAPYVWVKRQSSENPRAWRLAVADNRAKAVQTAALPIQDEGRMP